MKQKNYVAPSISERASRIRTSILAGSNVDPIHGNNIPFADARQRTIPATPSDGKVNQVLSF
jgi:hypothetical protein